eukprot:4477715-Pyramimonas_sp.AAC.1
MCSSSGVQVWRGSSPCSASADPLRFKCSARVLQSWLTSGYGRIIAVQLGFTCSSCVAPARSGAATSSAN